jgi:hypothetical protein
VVQDLRDERVLHDVGARVRGGEGDRDDEVREREPEEDEHERLALPARQELLEHEDAALAVRAVGGDLGIDGQGHEQRHQHEDESGQRRKEPAARKAMPGWYPRVEK